MFHLVTWLAIAGAIVAHTGAAIFFKISAQSKGRAIIGYFVLGNAIGFFNPLCSTIALHNNNPGLVYALMAGVGGVFFVVVLNRVFEERLGRWQWTGILVVLLGTFLLQWEAPDSSEGKTPEQSLETPFDKNGNESVVGERREGASV